MQFTSIKLKVIFLFTIVLSIFGCIEQEKIPSNVLTKQEMALCIENLLKAEDITRIKGLEIDSAKRLFLEHYKPLELKKLGITVAHFDSSYNYYILHANHFRDILDSTQVSLQKQIDSFSNPN